MTIILKSEEFRNDADDATIVVQRYADKDSVPMWRYFVKYDAHHLVSGCSDGLWNKPSTKWLRARF